MIWESNEQGLTPILPPQDGGISGLHFIQDY